MCEMWATASAATSILLIQTGVSASVSLFVLLIALDNLLLVTLIGLLGLTGLLSLSGLTGLVRNLVAFGAVLRCIFSLPTYLCFCVLHTGW